MQNKLQFTNSPTPDNDVKQVSYFKASQDHREPKEFIGFCNWLSQFIRAGDKEAKVRDLISVSPCNTLDLRPQIIALSLSLEGI